MYKYIVNGQHLEHVFIPLFNLQAHSQIITYFPCLIPGNKSCLRHPQESLISNSGTGNLLAGHQFAASNMSFILKIISQIRQCSLLLSSAIKAQITLCVYVAVRGPLDDMLSSVCLLHPNICKDGH